MAHLIAELSLPIAAPEPSSPEIHDSLLRFNRWANQSLRVTVQFYSYRSAVIGSTRMARRAGM
jgi:hypothetical protein